MLVVVCLYWPLDWSRCMLVVGGFELILCIHTDLCLLCFQTERLAANHQLAAYQQEPPVCGAAELLSDASGGGRWVLWQSCKFLSGGGRWVLWHSCKFLSERGWWVLWHSCKFLSERGRWLLWQSCKFLSAGGGQWIFWHSWKFLSLFESYY